MRQRCFVKENSNPPICGVHGVKLVRDQVLIDANAPGLRPVSCQACPVSRIVLDDPVNSN
jgi:hypothetical protein